jgi:hypothetical protein
MAMEQSYLMISLEVMRLRQLIDAAVCSSDEHYVRLELDGSTYLRFALPPESLSVNTPL